MPLPSGQRHPSPPSLLRASSASLFQPPTLLPPQVPARLWCEVEVGFIYKFPLIMSHWRNCLQTGDKKSGAARPQEETLFTFDFPLAAQATRAWPGQDLPAPSVLRGEGICRCLVGLSALLCKQDPGWRPGPALEMSVPSSPATSSSHPETPQSSDEGWWAGSEEKLGLPAGAHRALTGTGTNGGAEDS